MRADSIVTRLYQTNKKKAQLMAMWTVDYNLEKSIWMRSQKQVWWDCDVMLFWVPINRKISQTEFTKISLLNENIAISSRKNLF